MPIELIVALAVLVVLGGLVVLRRPSNRPAIDAGQHKGDPKAIDIGADAGANKRDEPSGTRADDATASDTTDTAITSERATPPTDDAHKPTATGTPPVGTFRPPPRAGSTTLVPGIELPPTGTAVTLPVDKPRSPARAATPSESERYRVGLRKTRSGFVARLADLFRGRPKVDASLRDQIEEVLLTADIGAPTAELLFDKLSESLDRANVADPAAVWSELRHFTREILHVPADPLDFRPPDGPYVLLMIGVNGVGKTTTLGKLASRHQAEGRRVLLVAGDTFRAAASEQLEVWATRVGCEIHQGKPGSDPSSVIYEGISRARREGHDVVLCDTAGRLHTRKELMDELQKIRRSAAKALSAGRDHPVQAHDTFLVLDATIGQNALSQARLFKETMAFTGLVITKLDGTAKGGVVLGICHELGLPIRYIGIGERSEDLREFDVDAFCDGLLAGSADDVAAAS